ncbi:MAG: hypothetical protein J2P15_11370, partial [Micromonosporaceae bacterium]|nr:hypothetical protein [Micromonosporaceae bacterium]
HKGQPGGDLIEGTTALFLTTVMREGADGYVAVNHDAVTGQTTEYHVNPRKLVQHFINYTPPKADRTELAIAP